ncbi:Calpactin II, partial [Intoshia linei]
GDTSGDYCQMLLALIGIRDAPIITQDDLDAVGDPPELEEVEEEKIEETPTVTPFSGFNCDEDCQVLKKAMKGFGTDEAAIIKVMGHRSSDQRVQIVENYKKLFNKDLRKELKSELSGDFEETILALCEGKLEHDAFQLMKSMKGLGTDENGLIDILCTRSSAQIEKIREYYKNKYKKNLEDDISSETSGHFKRLLISMTQANRPEGCVIDRAKARNDAKKIHEAAHKFGTDESRFNAILCSRSYAQLRATFEEYKKLTSKDIQDTIKDEMSGDLSAGMISIVQCVENKSKHFAKRLYQSTKGLGSDDNAIIRIVVGQCEIDMVQIKQQFQTIYQNSLKDYLSDDISGDYKKIILALIGEG